MPNSAGKPVAFLMYPQAETGEERKDPVEPTAFRYTVTAREVSA